MTWKSERRSAKGYEVGGKKGEREHLKADLGNMQRQHAPEIVEVTAGFCLTYDTDGGAEMISFVFTNPPIRVT